MSDIDTQIAALKKLREPFPAESISKLPKPTKAQTDAVKADFRNGVRCAECGAWHHPDVVHLDYVGHAALTHRLLEVDPFWTWEPFATGPDGLPMLDKYNGLWIRLTVAGMTRPGYGAADEGKAGPNALKEAIGDALRNAAMRFGAALDLWHKGDLFDAKEKIEGADNGKKQGKGVIKPTDGAWESFDAEAQEDMREFAMRALYAIDRQRYEDAHDITYIDVVEKYGNDGLVAYWTLFDSRQRGIIEGVRAIKQADSIEKLVKVWDSSLKYVQAALVSVKDKRKAELTPMEAAA